MLLMFLFLVFSFGRDNIIIEYNCEIVFTYFNLGRPPTRWYNIPLFLPDIPEARSRTRALHWAHAGIKSGQLNDSSRSPNVFFSSFSTSNGLRYGHKQTLSIYNDI